MKVDAFWNAARRRFDIRYRGVIVAHASHVLIRDPRYIVLKTGHVVRGSLEAWQGEATSKGRDLNIYPIWEKADQRYQRFANHRGHIVKTTVASFEARVKGAFDDFMTMPIERGEMALLRKGSPSNGPVMIDFDPCQMPEDFK